MVKGILHKKGPLSIQNSWFARLKKGSLFCILLCRELGTKPACELQQMTLGFNQTLIASVGICVRETHRCTFYSDLSAQLSARFCLLEWAVNDVEDSTLY